MIYQMMIIENADNSFRKLLKMCFSVILYLFIVYCKSGTDAGRTTLMQVEEQEQLFEALDSLLIMKSYINITVGISPLHGWIMQSVPSCLSSVVQAFLG